MNRAWSILGIAPVRDRDAIRRAYARRLKVTSPEDDAEAFAALRGAYEEALASLDWDWAWNDDAEPPAQPEILPETVPETAMARDAETPQPAPRPVEDTPAPAPPPPLWPSQVFGQLESLLRTERPPATEVVEAFNTLMALPALQDVTVQVDIELRVLQLILETIPRSDALVKPAIQAFGWTRGGVISRRDRMVDAVLDRESDIGFRKGISSPGVQLYEAYKVLSRPMTAITRWRARLSPLLDQDIRTLFQEIDTRRPTLAADFDPGAYAWWRQRLSKPGLEAWMRGVMICAPILAGLVGGLSEGSVAHAFMVWAAVQAGTVLLGMLYVYGYARTRDWWRSEWAWRAPRLVRIGWAPASWALLLLATMAPSQPWIAALFGVVAVAVFIWCLITRQVDASVRKSAWAFRSLLTEMFLIFWWIMLSAEPSHPLSASAQIAAAAAIGVSMCGSLSLIVFWQGEMSELARRYALAALAAAFAMAVALLSEDLRDQATAVPVMTIGFITVLVLAMRPVAVALEEVSNKLRARVILPGLIFGYGIMEAFKGHWLAVGGIWMLTGAAITLIVTTSQSLKRRPARR